MMNDMRKLMEMVATLEGEVIQFPNRSDSSDENNDAIISDRQPTEDEMHNDSPRVYNVRTTTIADFKISVHKKNGLIYIAGGDNSLQLDLSEWKAINDFIINNVNKDATRGQRG